MKLAIKANNRINAVCVSKNIDGTIKEVEIDFEPSYPWSDLELWLTNSETTKVLDYAKIYITKRGNMKFSK